ncbi:unnamed protein product [Pleuronectes platessa]|uniref:Uncharacterized protein n=1 Tax=Pleuronectes platessa TaxID=8262 RepID=A0A9N7Y9A7_PLEPL|nr:unnamed protein product [Pleuronectes platessa]
MRPLCGIEPVLMGEKVKIESDEEWNHYVHRNHSNSDESEWLPSLVSGACAEVKQCAERCVSVSLGLECVVVVTSPVTEFRSDHGHYRHRLGTAGIEDALDEHPTVSWDVPRIKISRLWSPGPHITQLPEGPFPFVIMVLEDCDDSSWFSSRP